MITRGDVRWASLTEPIGSGAGYRRPVVVIQGDAFNASRITTVVVLPLTSNLRRAGAPGNVVLTAETTGLTKDSVANVSQILAVDRALLEERTGSLGPAELELLFSGLDLVLGR